MNISTEKKVKVRHIDELGHDVSISDLVGKCLERALDQGASDIHLQPMDTGMVIRFRVDGLLHDVLEVSHDIETKIVSYLKTLADMDITERKIPIDGRFCYVDRGTSYEIRINATPVTGRGAKDDKLSRQRLVLRILDHRSVELPVNDLGFLPNTEEMIQRALRKLQGLILCTGPTGSGKTTLLYTMIRGIANPTINVMGVGDPPEYEIPMVSQCATSEVCTFASFVRSFLRQDADVILVGEIRDEATAAVVADAAVQGRMVLSSLHTRNAMLATFRLSNLGVDKSLLAEAMNLVINQRLARRLCPACRRREIVPTPPWIDLAEIQRGATTVGAGYGECDTTIESYVPGGVINKDMCDHCQGSGYIGRTGVFELLDFERLADTLRQSVDPGVLREAAIAEDALWPLAADAMAKVFAGIITLDDARVICAK